MNAAAGTDRHLSPQGFAEYLSVDVPVVLPLAGTPPVAIFIDPGRRRIGLRTPIATDAAAPPSPLENLHLAVVNADGVRQLEIASLEPELFADVYPMLCAVADRIQLEQAAPLAALEATLEIWGRLLARRVRLSQDQEVGLVGELLLLRALVEACGAADAVGAWRGPLAEEHDFGLPELDLEVKTTTGERRRHWITNLTQLVPSPSRALWLLSIQITRAGAGHGQTLAELVDAVRSLLGDDVVRARFEQVLRSLNWKDEQRDLYQQRWQLRSRPRALAVDGSFPALTSAALLGLGLGPAELTQVRYELDLTDRPSTDPPEPLITALEHLT
jgi:hypothetical protein